MSSIMMEPPTLETGFVNRSQVGVIIPTFRAAGHWKTLTDALALQGLPPQQVLIMDSDSEDGTNRLAEESGFRVLRLPQSEFNHGGTRQLGAFQLSWAKIIIYLTQDVILCPGAFDALLRAFDDPAVGAAYGRQLPHHGANPIEAHARHFNYPAQSRMQTFESRLQLGIKAAFLSNSFAAYRVAALQQAGGFPTDSIMAEDAIVAARMLISGWKIAYVAESQAHHSHPFTIAQEFRRYFDTGVYHARAKWLREQLGELHGEGRRFVFSELRALTPNHLYLVPYALARTAAKLAGYQLGLRERKLGKAWCERLSYHKSYWNSPNNRHP